MLDKTFIHRKIEFIQQDLLRLEEFKDKTFDEVAKDWRSFAIVKNLLMEIIGRGIDINQHILAEKFKPTISASSQSYSAGFTLIEILVVIAVLIITTAGGVVVWEKKAVFGQTVSPNESAIGVLRGVACTPSEWLCKTEDTVLPDVLCCWWHCLPKEILPPHKCPTNQDLGQKDGTGQTGDDRHYFYYDYDLEGTVQVPPVLPGQTNLPPAPPTSCNPPAGWPAGSGRVSLTYRACHLYSGCHSGIDIVTSENKPVYSTLTGKVVFAGDAGNAGKKVVVECGNWEYAVGFYHLNSINVKVGDQVTAGQTKIGTEGKSGRVTASHLHYEVWQNYQLVNPAPFLPYSGCVGWTEGGVGEGFCPGSGCTPSCPDTPACEKAREQGQCTTSLKETIDDSWYVGLI